MVACEITKNSSLRSQVRSKSLYICQDAIAAAHQLHIVVFSRGETVFAQSLSNVVVGANHVFMQVMPGQLIQLAREPSVTSRVQEVAHASASGAAPSNKNTGHRTLRFPLRAGFGSGLAVVSFAARRLLRRVRPWLSDGNGIAWADA